MYISKSLIINHKHRIHAVLHILHTLESLRDFASAFEQERHCDHSDCENISVLRHFCHYRSGASACSATHTGRDEDHACVRAFEHTLYFLLRLLGCGISLFRLRTGAKTFACLRTQQDFILDNDFVQSLPIGIHNDEVNSGDAFVGHVRNCVASTAANTDNLYY